MCMLMQMNLPLSIASADALSFSFDSGVFAFDIFSIAGLALLLFLSKCPITSFCDLGKHATFLIYIKNITHIKNIKYQSNFKNKIYIKYIYYSKIHISFERIKNFLLAYCILSSRIACDGFS